MLAGLILEEKVGDDPLTVSTTAKKLLAKNFQTNLLEVHFWQDSLSNHFPIQNLEKFDLDK